MTEIKKFLRPKPMVLITLEGWGVAPAHSANAISEADPKYFKYIISHYPALTLHATGKSVGSLLTVSVGTELGHSALGLGRPVVNYCSLIDQEIVSGNFEKSLKPLFVTMHTGAVHVVGLISTVQLEASVGHLQALLLVLKEVLPQGRKIFLHAILDGRDMSAKGGQRLLQEIEEKLQACNGAIASVTGRLFALDNHEHSSRLEKTVLAMVAGKGNTAISATQAVADSYVKKIFDEEFSPTTINDLEQQPVATISTEDTIVFFNCNPTSIRPLVSSFIKYFSGAAKLPRMLSLVEYDIEEVTSLFTMPSQHNFLGECIAEAGFRQIRISDSEGYVPITTFLNAGHEHSVIGEDRRLVPIPISTEYSTHPGLGSMDIAKETVKVIEENKYDFIAVNFSALDRVGHLSNITTAKAAVTSIDQALRKVVDAVLEVSGVAIIVGSHGLAEQLVSVNGEKFSPHTQNPVPFILVGNAFAGFSLGLPEAVGGDLSLLTPTGSLIDVAPTILTLMRLSVPSVMTGHSFFDELKLV